MKAGSELESYVKYVYETILNLKGENIVVSKNTTIFGNTGAKHEIDVFYQFTKANITHKVALECKDTENAVPKGKVQEFFAKIEDIPNIIGVMVSKNGYQSGAKTYADGKGILLLTSADLPTIFDLLSNQINKFFLPDENDIGEPFWTLMELDDDGNISGSYYSPQKDDQGNSVILLMFSKKQANELIEFRKIPKNKYTVRGLRQYHLKGMLLFIEKQNVTLALMPPYVSKNTPDGAVFLKNTQEIRNEFLLQR